jgi:hypothetical protein
MLLTGKSFDIVRNEIAKYFRTKNKGMRHSALLLSNIISEENIGVILMAEKNVEHIRRVLTGVAGMNSRFKKLHDINRCHPFTIDKASLHEGVIPELKLLLEEINEQQLYQI